jgi:hypothetical protein
MASMGSLVASRNRGGFLSGAAPVHSFQIFGLTMKYFKIFQLSLNVVDISQIFPRDSSVGF